MLEALKEAPPCIDKSDYKKNLTAALQIVSKRLGNTVAVCRKYYVHPELMKYYEEDRLTEYLCADKLPESQKQYGLHDDEEILMKFLKVIQKSKVELCLET
jgi:DNA topoisomerase-1